MYPLQPQPPMYPVDSQPPAYPLQEPPYPTYPTQGPQPPMYPSQGPQPPMYPPQGPQPPMYPPQGPTQPPLYPPQGPQSSSAYDSTSGLAYNTQPPAAAGMYPTNTQPPYGTDLPPPTYNAGEPCLIWWNFASLFVNCTCVLTGSVCSQLRYNHRCTLLPEMCGRNAILSSNIERERIFVLGRCLIVHLCTFASRLFHKILTCCVLCAFNVFFLGAS